MEWTLFWQIFVLIGWAAIMFSIAIKEIKREDK